MRGCGKGKEEEELWKEFQLNRVLLLFPSSLCGMCSRDLASAITYPTTSLRRETRRAQPCGSKRHKNSIPWKSGGKTFAPTQHAAAEGRTFWGKYPIGFLSKRTVSESQGDGRREIEIGDQKSIARDNDEGVQLHLKKITNLIPAFYNLGI